MRPNDHHVEPFFAGLGHRTEDEDAPAPKDDARRGDPTVKWKLLAVALGLAALAWLVASQAF